VLCISEICTLSLRDALPISDPVAARAPGPGREELGHRRFRHAPAEFPEPPLQVDVVAPLVGEVEIGPFERGDGLVRPGKAKAVRSEEHTTELQSRENLVCRL